MCGHTRDLVIYSKFHRNPFIGFGAPGGHNSAFPITLASGAKCVDSDHCDRIADYYRSVLDCFRNAADAHIPVSKSSNDNRHNIPGWNDYVYEKHHEARLAYRDWLSDNKQRHGPLFICMQRTRANFKLALRHCRIHENQLRADVCASLVISTIRMLLNSGNLLIESIMVRQLNLHILLVVKLVQITLLKCGKNTFRICIIVFLLRLIQLHFGVS